MPIGSDLVCDPSFEKCSANEAILRPNGTDLNMLALQYFVEIFSTPILFTGVYLITGNESSYLTETRRYMDRLNVMVWGVPFFFLSWYITFGSDWMPFSLTDEVGVYLIQYWVSNMSPLVHYTGVSVLLGTIFTTDYGENLSQDGYYYCDDDSLSVFNDQCPSEFVSLVYLALYIFQSLWFDYNHIVRGVKAIRHMDPYWNDHRGLLYPSVVYDAGLVSDEN